MPFSKQDDDSSVGHFTRPFSRLNGTLSSGEKYSNILLFSNTPHVYLIVLFTVNPDVSIQRELYTSDLNQKISIQCFVSPNQDLYIHWYKDGVFLEDIGLDIRTGSILILKDVQEEDSGVYTCEAGNSRATTTVLIGKGRSL